MAESPLKKDTVDDDPNNTAAFEGAPSTTPSLQSQPTSDVTTDFNQSDSNPSASANTSAAKSKQAQISAIAGYRLEQLLGEGGMGRVYKASDGQGRAVAIKLLSARWTCSDEALQRFKQEGYIASQINHPHCVFVHRVDEDRGTPFIAMELMSGRTLKDLVVERGPLPYKEAVQLILQCVDGLVEAHRQGMIHRDIKPANCYLDEHGTVKIGDFGLARSLVDDSELTRTGAFLGTPLFASPEQLLGQKLDERSDIYSLSATLYYLLAGRAPFESPNAAQVIAKIASSDPPAFAEVNAKVPYGLEGIVMRGLARDRNKRFETFQQLRVALLPIVAADSDIASLPRRMLAGFIDATVSTTIAAGITLALLRFTLFNYEAIKSWLPLSAAAGTSMVIFLYYWLQEWLLGCSLGKRLMRLRVVDAETGGRATMRQTAVRSGLFVINNNGIELLFDTFYRGSISFVPFVAWGSELTGWLIMFVFWWLTGKRQFAHEWLTSTFTKISVPQRAAAHVQLTLPDWPVTTIKIQTPAMLGRFKIMGQLETLNQSQWFVAHDEGLERQVWINLLPSGAPPLPEQRKKCTRRARMRVIESGMEGSQSWDAYLAPEGVPLSACIHGGTVLPWPLARQLFHQLIDEHSTADSVALREEDWNGSRIWLDAAGRATFCEPELKIVGPLRPAGLSNLLCDVAWAALPLRHRLRKQRSAEVRSNSSLPRQRVELVPVADLPPYRGLLFLERLVRGGYRPDQLKQELTRIDQTTEQVTPSLRLAHAVTLGIVMLPLLATVWIIMAMSSVMYVNQLRKEARGLMTLASIIEAKDEYADALAAATPAHREHLLKPGVVDEVRVAAVTAHQQSRSAYEYMNMFERAVLAQANLDRARIESTPPPYIVERESAEDRSVSSDGAPLRIKVGGQDAIKAEGFSDDRVSEKTVIDDFYPHLTARQTGKVRNDNMTWVATTMAWIFGSLWLWTVVTGGGLLQIFTGVATVRRDGCRISRLRLAWRSFLLFAPLAGVAFLFIYLESLGIEWMGWSSQLKNAFALIPLLYLISALVWPQVAPHDRLSYSAAVPR